MKTPFERGGEITSYEALHDAAVDLELFALKLGALGQKAAYSHRELESAQTMERSYGLTLAFVTTDADLYLSVTNKGRLADTKHSLLVPANEADPYSYTRRFVNVDVQAMGGATIMLAGLAEIADDGQDAEVFKQMADHTKRYGTTCLGRVVDRYRPNWKFENNDYKDWPSFRKKLRRYS